MMDILIAIPYTDNRLFDETVTCALALDIPAGARVDYLFQRGNGDDLDLPDRRARIVRKRNAARDAALSGGYDYLCFIDSDVVFHPDTLLRLYSTMTEHDPAVAYGLYVVRKEPHWWCCSVDMEIREDGQACHYVLSNDPQAARAMWDEPALHVTGIGFGMTLVNCELLPHINFRYVENSIQYEDYWFGFDVKQAGYLQMMNLTARLGHIMTDCKHVVWPDNGEQLYKITELV